MKKKNKVLELVKKKFFNVGIIFNCCNFVWSKYLVSSVKDLQAIKEHFDKYPLNSQKGADF